MSVSSHLTPDPERRLRIIYGNLDNAVKWADSKLGAVTIFAAAQAVAVKYLLPDGIAGQAALVILCAVVPVGLLGVSPFLETLHRLPLLDPRQDKLPDGNYLVNEYDISKYSQAELTSYLDRYLGGGITATPYYEDIVAQIVISARIATRKRRLFAAACALAGGAQLFLLARLLLR